MLPSIEALKAFKAVVETGSFTRAAERVYRTQAAVSIQMRSLEKRLGRSLFQRDRRGAILTNDGRLLLAYANRILSAHSELLSEFTSSGIAGSVRLGTADDYAVTVLPQLLSRFNELFPNVNLHTCCASTDELRKALRLDEVDLAILSLEPDAAVREELHVLLTDRLVWVVAQNTAIHTTRPLPLAIHNRISSIHEWPVLALEKAGVSYRVAFSGSSAAVLHAAISAGIAVAPLMRSAITPGLKEVDEDAGLPALPSVRVCLALPERPLSDASERLARHLIKNFSNIATYQVGRSAELASTS